MGALLDTPQSALTVSTLTFLSESNPTGKHADGGKSFTLLVVKRNPTTFKEVSLLKANPSLKLLDVPGCSQVHKIPFCSRQRGALKH
jgi:hypothetical protein